MRSDRSLLWLFFAACIAGCGVDDGEHVLQPTAAPEIHGLAVRSGRPLSLHEQRGKCVLLAFGYTRCSDLCPTTLATMSAVLSHLGPLAPRLQALYVSIDPARDTPDAFRAFLQPVDPRIEGLSLAREELARVAPKYAESVSKRAATLQRYLVHGSASASGQSDYSLVHTGGLWLVDTQGQLRVRYDHEAAAALIAEGTARLLLDRP